MNTNENLLTFIKFIGKYGEFLEKKDNCDKWDDVYIEYKARDLWNFRTLKNMDIQESFEFISCFVDPDEVKEEYRNRVIIDGTNVIMEEV